MTDRRLLQQYASSRSKEAFAQLVHRHAGMVYSTCLRMLGEQSEAEQATQATFLILSRKAQHLATRNSVAGWLYTTAYRVACRAKRAAARQRRQDLTRQLAQEKVLIETSQYAAVD